MDLKEAHQLYSVAPEDSYTHLLAQLLPRERDAILVETRIPEAHWQQIISKLDVLCADVSSATADVVRKMISEALDDAILVGPLPSPCGIHCERVVSYSNALGYFSRELSMPRFTLEDHLDAWEDPSRKDSLRACKHLIGQFLTGMRPTWTVPFNHGDDRPFKDCCASECHQRLALFPEIDNSEKLVMTYELPSGVRQTVPTIGDAYRWNDNSPYWRSYFLPCPPDENIGRTAPLDSQFSGFPEIVHEPITLLNLTFPLQKRV